MLEASTYLSGCSFFGLICIAHIPNDRSKLGHLLSISAF